MSIFPTQYSTLSSVALKHRIEDAYGFSGLNCRLLLHGVSDTYILEDEQSPRYIFKVYRDSHRKLDEIKGELELLNILKAGGAKVAHPIEALNGDWIQSFNAAEGTRYGVLFLYAQGQPVMAMDDEQLKTVGREMATLHNLTVDLQLKHQRKVYDISTTLTGPLATVKPSFKNLQDEYAYLSQAVTEIAEKLQQIDLTSFSYGYCHYDFLPKNFHFTDDGDLMFFDFDFAGEGYLINDIASFYIHYFLEVYTGKITRAQADHSFSVFVESYRTVRPLSDDELKTIPYFGLGFWVFYLGFQYENFDDWSSIFWGPNFIKARIALIKNWMRYFNQDS